MPASRGRRTGRARRRPPKPRGAARGRARESPSRANHVSPWPRRAPPRQRRARTRAGSARSAGCGTTKVSPARGRRAPAAPKRDRHRRREPALPARTRRAVPAHVAAGEVRGGVGNERPGAGAPRPRAGCRRRLARTRAERVRAELATCIPSPFCSTTTARPSSGGSPAALYPTMPPECPIVRRPSTLEDVPARTRSAYPAPRASSPGPSRSRAIGSSSAVGNVAPARSSARVRAHVRDGRDDRAVGGVR